MSTETAVALLAYAFVTSITPGPNNLMLLSSGVTYGFTRTIPHMFGVGIGFVVMVVIVGLGVGGLLQSNPQVYLVLKYLSVVYMLWLAWKIANSGAVKDAKGRTGSVPLTFMQAALFQWINPKAWAMALTATALYTNPDNYLGSLILTAAIFGLVNLPSVSSWAAFGVGLRGVLRDPFKVRIFNVAMALLLVASISPVAYELVAG